MRTHRPREIDKPYRPASHTDALAEQLHEHYRQRNGFPAWWEFFGNDLSALKLIFRFYRCLLDMLSRQPPAMIDLLDQRLRTRLAGRLDVPQAGTAVHDWRCLAREQRALFDMLDIDLLGPAIDAFAAGSLAIHAQPEHGPLSVGLQQAAPELPEPDSGYYLYWMESALVALEINEWPDAWTRSAQALLRGQHIFIRAYGRVDERGHPPVDWTFRSYNRQSHSPVMPVSVERIRFEHLGTLEELSAETLCCVRLALPGGMGD